MISNTTLEDAASLKHSLQDAVISCADRCLYQSAKWAAEMLNSLAHTNDADDDEPDTEVDSIMSTPETESAHVETHFQQITSTPRERQLEKLERHRYLLAKTYFDCREYDRCAAVFLPAMLPKGQVAETNSTPNAKRETPSTKKTRAKTRAPLDETSVTGGCPSISEKALFLALYAKYMSGEKRKDEDSEMILGPADNGLNVNRELVSIGRILQARFELQEERSERGQGWLEYLYGTVLIKGKDDEEAKRWLLKSLALYPFNWSAWLELGSLITSTDGLQSVLTKVPSTIMSLIFLVYENQELFQTHDFILQEAKKLKALFPASSFIKCQKALLYYHAKDFEKAERSFSKLVSADPLRIDDLDTYSNMLYVMEKRPKLAFLAQLATATDKFRPETCCVVGNYYALKGEHEKAVMYFRRALTLDRNFMAAWTLMGHEYVELKNTQAAIECYRRAVDVNRKDFRAWYGLGQTYEMLEMRFYAVFYYQRAAALSPFDPKMWSAIGSCFAKMNKPAQAIKAYKRSLVARTHKQTMSLIGVHGRKANASPMSAPMDPETLLGIATMYDRLGDREELRAYLELTIAQEEGPEVEQEPSILGASVASIGTTGRSDVKPQGVGVTVTTSKARMWLTKVEFALGGEHLRRALELANELCQDGWEVEEAKALIKDIRGKMAMEDSSQQ